MGPGSASATIPREVLAQIQPYSVLDDVQLDWLADRCRIRTLGMREVLLQDGSVVTNAYILTKGYLMRSIYSPEGACVLLNDTHPVTSFGCAAAFHMGPHVGMVEAARPSEVITVPLDAIKKLFEESPVFALAMARVLAQSSVRQTEFVRELLFPVPVRVARFLCRRHDAGASAELEMSKTSLAEMLATVPETLSRALGSLRSQGLVEVNGRVVRILDIGALRAYAQLS